VKTVRLMEQVPRPDSVSVAGREGMEDRANVVFRGEPQDVVAALARER
jgi:hypothetical protein